MKLLILYRPNSEHATPVESFVRDMEMQHDMEGKIELVSVDTRDGSTVAALYDVWSFPAIVLADNEGKAINVWQGEQLPLMDEVVGYMNS
jgi:thioredoxin-like negative regulator of GroEL